MAYKSSWYKILLKLVDKFPTPKTPDELAEDMDIPADEIQRECLKMLDKQELYGPLVELCRDGWRITGIEDFDDSTGGRGYLREAFINPYYPTNIEKFKDECLTGMSANGKQTELRNAALPSGYDSGGCRDPESRALGINQRLTTGRNELGAKQRRDT